MKDEYDFSKGTRGKFYRKGASLDKLRAGIEAGWRQIEQGSASDFDPEAVKRRGREKLTQLKDPSASK